MFLADINNYLHIDAHQSLGLPKMGILAAHLRRPEHPPVFNHFIFD